MERPRRYEDAGPWIHPGGFVLGSFSGSNRAAAAVVCWRRNDWWPLVPSIPSPTLVEKYVGIWRPYGVRAHFRDVRIVVLVPLSGANLGERPGVCVVMPPRKT